jgi:hypothetical protein
LYVSSWYEVDFDVVFFMIQTYCVYIILRYHFLSMAGGP